MAMLPRKLLRVVLIVAMLGGLYLVALERHAERDRLRAAAVELTPGCKQKLSGYGLAPDKEYRSPYVRRVSDAWITTRGYSAEDVRAIERGCNIIDDLQGHYAKDAAERWFAKRFVRGSHTTCDHCHQGIGDKQDAAGNRLVGSNSMAASWVMADMYDRFTGLLLPHELRQMQCYINSSNGFKPNAADDLMRDVTAYSRFLAAALDMKIGNHYLEQGIAEIPASATLKRGDDYVRGAHLYKEKCARCHGPQGLGTVVNGKAVYPAVAGPNAYSMDSRMNFAMVNSVMPGFICRNMPPGGEGSLENQDCRDIAYYLGTLPRAAGDRQGPLVAAWQQLMMTAMPPLTRYAESLVGNRPLHDGE
ncbi:MAG TPA: c-type cytochrome [Burkholderiales bacterium]|jgi:thiosulfate dehydrogenase|nr:c-type cytochrome [Burkholderiales bacterium]